MLTVRLLCSAVEDGLRVREAELRAQINQQLEESGEKSALKELLKSELLQSGWRDELKTHCAGNQHHIEIC